MLKKSKTITQDLNQRVDENRYFQTTKDISNQHKY